MEKLFCIEDSSLSVCRRILFFSGFTNSRLFLFGFTSQLALYAHTSTQEQRATEGALPVLVLNSSGISLIA